MKLGMFTKAEEGRKSINAHTIKSQKGEEAQNRHCWEQEKTKTWQSKATECQESIPPRSRQEKPKCFNSRIEMGLRGGHGEGFHGPG